MKRLPRTRRLVGWTVALSIVLASTALAQVSPTPGVQSVVAFMRVLDVDTVRAAEARHGEASSVTATALLDDLLSRGLVAADLAEVMRVALDARFVPRSAFVLYLADLLNGVDVLATREVRDAERRLERLHCGILIPDGITPDGSAERMLDGDDVGAVVGQFVANAACILRGLGNDYGDPVF